MTPKEFIQKVFIDQLKTLIDPSPYIAFAIMAIGIEFLGKCLDTEIQNWNARNSSKKHFELAIKKLHSLNKYKPYLKSHRLYDSFRNGFAHSFVPKNKLSLSSKNEAPHLHLFNNGNTINLKCENFYQDFKNACLEIIKKNFDNPNDKMNKKLLSIPQKNNS